MELALTHERSEVSAREKLEVRSLVVAVPLAVAPFGVSARMGSRFTRPFRLFLCIVSVCVKRIMYNAHSSG